MGTDTTGTCGGSGGTSSVSSSSVVGSTRTRSSNAFKLRDPSGLRVSILSTSLLLLLLLLLLL